MSDETFEQIAVRVCAELDQKLRRGWITVDGQSEIEKIWVVLDAIIKELDRRAKP